MSIIDWPLDKWLENVALCALSSKETLLATFDLARSVIERGVPGDFVECGVYGGSQCAAMARAIMDSGYDPTKCRRVHLYDSFEGIPEPGPEDMTFSAGGHPIGLASCSMEAVKEHMAEWGIPDELLVYHPGWFEETIGRRTPAQICMLRVDADLYHSTKIVLANLYRYLSPGGWCIVDDYGLDGARKAVEEYMQGNYPPVYWQRMP